MLYRPPVEIERKENVPQFPSLPFLPRCGRLLNLTGGSISDTPLTWWFNIGSRIRGPE